ncbi:putative transcriptional regulator YdeE [Lipingzhangella halophila]|uniref:Putative transcriptional regulator YdeE n=1 Tax=Lipingzhangella halophila TaxID=1783352 RepID=A0A7W7W682_9ACTN|nr:hypothetical protein [Lipingzhangella halophila]MBB4935476.1 putative transcriptional regulator YdeE [Lipingzhangella halophila]
MPTISTAGSSGGGSIIDYIVGVEAGADTTLPEGYTTRTLPAPS